MNLYLSFELRSTTTHFKMNLAMLLVLFTLGLALDVAAMGSFVTKTGNGFERLVVSIDERLASPPLTPASSSSSPSFSSGTVTSSGSAPTTVSGPTGLNGATQECQKVLEQLKGLITRTSEYLFEATNGQTYFRQVSILLPSNWANSNCTGEPSSSFSDRHYQFNQEVSTATFQTPSSADIHVTADHPVYIDKPWTLQYGPCGVPGKKISIPISFITEEGSEANPDSLRARLMVREWVKFRYGVFEENGFARDEKYPAEFVGPDGKVVPTACHLNRSSSCTDPELCDTVHHHNHHHHNHNHHVHGKAELSSGNLSDAPFGGGDTSMMSLPLHNSVNEFCDERTHIRTTPTKHNFLCDGQSIWEVMKQHADFKNMEETSHHQAQSGGQNTQQQPNGSMESSTASGSTLRSIVSAPPPVFSYVTAKSHRIVFLLDRSSSMSHNNRWSNLRRSLYRMFHQLPSGVELGVISYTNMSSVSLPLTMTSTHNRDILYGRIPVRAQQVAQTGENEESCVSCALKNAVKLIKSSSENVGPATLILVNGSPTKINNREWDRVMKIVENTPLRVIVITYEEDNTSDGTKQLMDLGRFGGVFKVTDQGTSGNHNLGQNEVLSNIFIQIISENLGTPLNKVYDSVHWPDSEWQARGKFTIEDSLGRNTWVTVTTEENGDVDGLQLVSPSGKEFDLPLTAEGMVYQKIPGAAEAGTWGYNIKFYHNYNNLSPRPVSVDVITESRKPESVSMKFWNQVVKQTMHQEVSSPSGSVTELPYNMQDDADAEVVLLYAQVLQGDIPVLNANVTAIVTLPGSPRHGPSAVSVKLLDTGSGDPDITWGDGIYSAYFTQLGSNPGLFTVSVQIDDNNGQAVVPVHTNITRKSYDKPVCCGTSVPHIATVPTGSFVRKIAGNSFYIENGLPLEEDPYPPGRVTDLHVERVIDSASEIKLTWTAPGGDYDKGKAARYEIRCYINREALMNENFSKQGILVHSTLTPEPEEYGVRQSCTVAVPWANDYFYYGIVAIDSSHNRGKVSNLVSVLIKETTTPTGKMSNAWEDDALVSNLTSSRSNSKGQGVFQAGASWFRGLSELELYLVLGGGGVFLILVSVFILLLACVKRRGNKSSEAPPSYHNIYTQNNGKGGPSSPNSGKDGISCCWENESGNHTETKPASQTNQKSSMNGNYITSNTSSYIPASALCSPVPVQPNSVYRDMYAGSNSTQHTHTTHDSSSVDSKPSDGGSHDTVQISDNLNSGPTPYYVQNPTTPVTRMPPMNVPFDPMSIQFGHHGLTGGVGMHSNNVSLLNQPHHNNLSRDSTYLTKSAEYNASDDDEGGFRSQRRDNLDGLHHKTVPMPTASDYDSPSVMNGSTYGGSVISLPNSNKKRTRHISFV